MRIDQYRTEPADPKQRAAWMRMIQREAYQYQDEREIQRRIEDDILAHAARLVGQSGDMANHYREVAAQIDDHRANGNYTTLHR